MSQYVRPRSVVISALVATLASIVVGSAFAASIVGTAKNDTLRGTAKADRLLGQGGNDKLYGLGGADTLQWRAWERPARGRIGARQARVRAWSGYGHGRRPRQGRRGLRGHQGFAEAGALRRRRFHARRQRRSAAHGLLGDPGQGEPAARDGLARNGQRHRSGRQRLQGLRRATRVRAGRKEQAGHDRRCRRHRVRSRRDLLARALEPRKRDTRHCQGDGHDPERGRAEAQGRALRRHFGTREVGRIRCRCRRVGIDSGERLRGTSRAGKRRSCCGTSRSSWKGSLR